jgi:HlyD family secretion protein
MASAPPPRVRWFRRPGLRWLAVVALAVGALAWWQLKPQAVEAVTLRSQPLVRTLQFTGRVKTPARVELGSTVTGRVQRVLVKEGDVVESGAPLVQLEQSEWRAGWEQAQAALVQAQARLDSQQALALPTAQASLAQAQANALAAQRDLERTQALVAEQFYSPSKLDESQRALDVARAQLKSAQAQVQANREGGERGNARAQVASARSAVEVARAKLDQSVLCAPGNGRVLVRSVEPGQIVQAGKALLTVSLQGPLELVAQVDERYLAQLQAGQRAKVLADAYPSQPFDARIDRLAPSVDAQSGSLEVTFVLPGQPPAFLREDMTLSIEVVTGERTASRVLPLRALRQASALGQPDLGQVMVIEGGKAVPREVKLGLRTLEQVEVTSGLSDQDLVVLDATVADGARVRARAVPAVRSAAPAPIPKAVP